MEQGQNWAPQQLTTIFIGGLSQDTKEKDIVKYVERFCPVKNIHWPMNKTTHKPLSFAFLEVDNPMAAQAIVNRINVIKGRIVDCQFAVSQGQKEFYKEDLQRRKVFIAGIRSYVSFQNLVEILRKRGSLKHCYKINSSHPNRGLAMAEFTDSRSAEQLVTYGLVVDNCPLRVSFFRPKESSSSGQLSPLQQNQPIIMLEDSERPIAYDQPQKNQKKARRRRKERNSNSSDNSQHLQSIDQTFQQEQKSSEIQKTDDNYQFRILRPEDSLTAFTKAKVHGSVVFYKTSRITATTEEVKVGEEKANISGNWIKKPQLESLLEGLQFQLQNQPISTAITHNLEMGKEGRSLENHQGKQKQKRIDESIQEQH